MNFKYRLALFFTLYVAMILAVSSVSIYLLYKANRKSDFYMRLKARCDSTLKDYVRIKIENVPEKPTARKRRLYLENMTVFNEKGEILYKEEDSAAKLPPIGTIGYFRQKKDISFEHNGMECITFYSPEKDLYVMGGAYDRTGFRKVNNLAYILIGVFSCCLMLTAATSYFIVEKSMQPLLVLSEHMKSISTNNLGWKVDEKPGEDEITQISVHFNAMLDRLKRGIEGQNSFVRHASHEIRTPLANMLSQTEAALNQNLGPTELKSVLLSLKEDQTEMIGLTNSLLTLSQIEIVGNSLDLQSERIDELLFETVSLAEKLFPNIVLSLFFMNAPSSESELTYRCNASLIKSVFRNLIKNAYQYSLDKKVEISICSSESSLSVIFENVAHGLSKVEIDNLFVPFFRGANAQGTKGYGLGLSIIKRILDIHEAVVSYEHVDEKLNKFTCRFNKKTG